jgi:hypothetical protein
MRSSIYYSQNFHNEYTKQNQPTNFYFFYLLFLKNKYPIFTKNMHIKYNFFLM